MGGALCNLGTRTALARFKALAAHNRRGSGQPCQDFEALRKVIVRNLEGQRRQGGSPGIRIARLQDNAVDPLLYGSRW